jgi:hypothetical protein
MKKTEITEFMQKYEGKELLEKLNDFISPKKKLQPEKGVQFGRIVTTSEGTWSSLSFPQWVRLEDEATKATKTYRFKCDANGKFIAW